MVLTTMTATTTATAVAVPVAGVVVVVVVDGRSVMGVSGRLSSFVLLDSTVTLRIIRYLHCGVLLGERPVQNLATE
jgi:hypothetical protein